MTDDRTKGRDGAAKPGKLDAFLHGCLGTFQHDTPLLIDALFDKLDDALYDLADKAGSDRLYARYFDAMRLFRKQSRNIKTIFARQLQRAGELAASGQGAPDSIPQDAYLDSLRMDDFSLVEEADLEESLAIGNLVSKAENRYHRHLHELGRYLGPLLGRRELPPRTNPLGPVAICAAFGAALKPMQDLDLAIKLVVYKLFDKQVMDHLGEIYDQCLSLASAHGLTQTLAPRPAAQPPPALRAVPSFQPGQRAQVPEEAIALIVGPIPFDQLRSLLDQWRPPRAAAASDHPGEAIVVQTSELMGMLSDVQEASRFARSGHIPAQEIQARLDNALRADRSGRGARPRSLGEIDEDTLELVLLLFDSIIQGGDLPDAIKALVGRLQIPLVKAALLDKTFFDDPQHPARRLVNRIADAAVGWSDSDERTPDSLYGRIEKIIDRIVGEFGRDLSLFARLDAELAAYLAQEAPLVRAVEATVCSAAADRDRTAAAQRKAQAVVDQRLQQGPRAPAVIESLLKEGWSEVLNAAYLSGGGGSTEWRNAVVFVDRLLWSVRPKVTPDDRRALLQRIPELLRTLRVGLTGIAFDQRLLARWLKELQALHLTALRGADASLAAVGPAASVPRQGTAARAAHPAGAPGSSRRRAGGTESANLSLRLVPGCWVELVRDDARRVRVKLAWISTDGERLQFVDRQGREGPQLARDDLATLLQYGLASIVRSDDDPPLVDRAITSIAQTLSH